MQKHIKDANKDTQPEWEKAFFVHQRRMKINNCFKTEDEALAKAEEIKKVLMK